MLGSVCEDLSARVEGEEGGSAWIRQSPLLSIATPSLCLLPSYLSLSLSPPPPLLSSPAPPCGQSVKPWTEAEWMLLPDTVFVRRLPSIPEPPWFPSCRAVGWAIAGEHSFHT